MKQELRPAKKSDGVLREGLQVRYALMTTLRAQFSMTLMSRVFEVSKSGYYAWLAKMFVVGPAILIDAVHLILLNPKIRRFYIAANRRVSVKGRTGNTPHRLGHAAARSTRLLSKRKP
ncbi:MAG: hypothetical protein HYX63_15035 [Gammaproteobacteria bacterium]|nr:hypothetical protein [Gammaproteobacteria bacterium]